jgi:hypothetical protein
MRALERDRSARYATGQAMADDLEVVLHETGFHSRMVGDLLREAFGSDLSTSQESLSKVTPELLAKLVGEDGEPGTGTLPSSSGTKRRQWSWQRGFSLVGAAAVTAALAGLLLARGGGGSSLARLRTAAEPATAIVAPPVDPVPPAAIVTPKPTASEPAAAAPAAAGTEGADADDEASAEPTRERGKHRSKRSHRHRSSRREAEPEDRVVRGLSVDPFAEAKRGGQP